MKKHAFIGGGFLCDQFIEYIGISHNDALFFDDILLKGRNKLESRPFKEYETYDFTGYNVYLTLGYKHLELRKKIAMSLAKRGFEPTGIIHNSCLIEKSADVHSSSTLYPLNYIGLNSVIHSNTLVNASCILSHDVVIGSNCWLGAGVNLSGYASVGNNTFIGSGTIISNNIQIGSNCIIGIGSLVTKSIPNGTSVIGNPMKILSKPLRIS